MAGAIINDRRPDLDVVTAAAKAAHTQCHLHYWIVELTRTASRDEILDAFRAAPRIAFVRMASGKYTPGMKLKVQRSKPKSNKRLTNKSKITLSSNSIHLCSWASCLTCFVVYQCNKALHKCIKHLQVQYLN